MWGSFNGKKHTLLLPYDRNKKLYNSFPRRSTCFVLFISSSMFHEGASAWRNCSPTPACQLKGCLENADVGYQCLLFEKMNPGSIEMSGERANMKCLLHTVPALIAIDFQEWYSEDRPNICRLSEKEWRDSLVRAADVQKEFEYASHACFISKQRQDKRSKWGVEPGDLRQINNYWRVRSGGHEGAIFVELLSLRRNCRAWDNQHRSQGK